MCRLRNLHLALWWFGALPGIAQRLFLALLCSGLRRRYWGLRPGQRKGAAWDLPRSPLLPRVQVPKALGSKFHPQVLAGGGCCARGAQYEVTLGTQAQPGCCDKPGAEGRGSVCVSHFPRGCLSRWIEELGPGRELEGLFVFHLQPFNLPSH